MTVVSWDDFLKESPWKGIRTSMTLGVFDGVHKGHQRLLERLCEDESLDSIVFTFKVNPAAITRAKAFNGNILTLRQKLERMEKFGVKGAVIIDFSSDFSKLTGRKFFSLVEKNTELSRVVLGENHRLGHKGESGAKDARGFLQQAGVDVFIEDSLLNAESPVSSTRIRLKILEGDLKSVAPMMGVDHILDLRGLDVKRQKGRMSLTVGECRQVLPPEGKYKGLLAINQELFATTIILDKEHIMWEQPENVPIERITLRNYEQEET